MRRVLGKETSKEKRPQPSQEPLQVAKIALGGFWSDFLDLGRVWSWRFLLLAGSVFRKQVDHLSIVRRLAATYPILIAHHLFIQPFGSCIFQIILDGVITG